MPAVFEGTVRLAGNAPFLVVMLNATDGRSYQMIVSPADQARLSELQYKRIHVQGRASFPPNNVPNISVMSWQPLP